MSRRAPFQRRPALLARFLLAFVLVTGVPVRAGAQQRCAWGNGTRRFKSVELPTLGRVTYVSHPHLVCADGVEIWADTAVSYANQGWSDLFGHVRYQDRTRELRSDSARYFGQVARLQAHGSLFVRDTVQGSIIRNGDLVYLMKSRERSEDQMTVTTGADGVRPHATLYMRPAPDTARARPALDTARVGPDTTRAGPTPDTARAADTARSVLDTLGLGIDTVSPAPPPAPDTTPYDVVADRIFLRGNRYFLATGRVEIQRDSLQAYSDSAKYDQAGGRLLLDGHSRVYGSSYDLRAAHIQVGVPGGAIRDVRARGDAVLLGRDLRLTSPSIHMLLRGGLLDRLVAVPLLPDSAVHTPADSAEAVRPVAVAEKFHLIADSIQVDAPGQQLKRIFATGQALGQSDARDSLNVASLPEVARKDWIQGDTVIVTFVPVPKDSLGDTLRSNPGGPPDSAQARFRVDQLVASGAASSLYRLSPSDSTGPPGVCLPAIHYVKGSRITIVMKKDQVDSMLVDGPAQGYHLEPRERCGADTTKADSLAPGRDTAVARSDTSALGTDSLRAGHAPRGPSESGGRNSSRARGGLGVPWRSEPPGLLPTKMEQR